MEYVYAAMLLHKAGKEIDEKNVSEVLTAAGINADAARVNSTSSVKPKFHVPIVAHDIESETGIPSVGQNRHR